jgi:hypothetical protein
MNKQTNKNQNQTKKFKKRKTKKNSTFKKNSISVLVYVLELFLWHSVLILAY